MQFIKRYHFTLIAFIYLVIANYFFEYLPVNNGLGWDGWNYYDIAVNLLNSGSLNTYTSLRVGPSIFVHLLVRVLNLGFTPEGVLTGFRILNTICLTLGVFFVQKIFYLKKVDFKIQLFGFILLTCNYFFLKFSTYYIVLTDFSAFFLSSIMLYYYFAGNKLNILLISIIGFFTWPIVVMQAVFLLCYDSNEVEYKETNKTKHIIPVLFVILLFILSVYYLYTIKFEQIYPYTLMQNTLLLPVSIAFVLLFYFGLGQYFSNDNLFSKQLFSQIRKEGIVLAGVLVVIVLFTLKVIQANLPASDQLSSVQLLKVPLLHATLVPGIFLVSQFSFYGIIIVLFMIFHKQLRKGVYKLGYGFFFAFLSNMFLLGITTECRILVNLMPYAVVLLCLVLDKEQLTYIKTGIIGILSLLVSKVWLIVNFDLQYSQKDLTRPIGFPNQKFMMHLGIWMSEMSYYILLAGFVVTFVIVFFMFKKNNYNNGTE